MPDWLFNNPYPAILAITLLLSPLIISIAANQKKEIKKQLKFILLSLLSTQVFLGFLNWENLGSGRTGFELSFTYPSSYLGFFFMVSATQAVLLLLNKYFYTLVVILNFLNSILIFIGIIRLSNILGFQAVSLPSVGAVFLVLIGNVTGLAFINKQSLIPSFQSKIKDKKIY